jgi:hypothetical protein
MENEAVPIHSECTLSLLSAQSDRKQYRPPTRREKAWQDLTENICDDIRQLIFTELFNITRTFRKLKSRKLAYDYARVSKGWMPLFRRLAFKTKVLTVETREAHFDQLLSLLKQPTQTIGPYIVKLCVYGGWAGLHPLEKETQIICKTLVHLEKVELRHICCASAEQKKQVLEWALRTNPQCRIEITQATLSTREDMEGVNREARQKGREVIWGRGNLIVDEEH